MTTHIHTKRLTCVALLVVHGDEADAGAVGDVLGGPGRGDMGVWRVEEAQGVARGVAHRLQLLPLGVRHHWGNTPQHSTTSGDR